MVLIFLQMAAIQSSSFPAISSICCPCSSLLYPSRSASPSVCFASPSTAAAWSLSLPENGRRSSAFKSPRKACTAMVQEAVKGAPATYAKEMERLSAKESLLLALKDAGGFEALVTGKTTDMQRIDVNERIISLERLNPTPRPTTSPFLEGRWNFEWFGSGSPGLFAARFIFPSFPSNLANLSKLDVVIKDGIANVTANLKLLYSIESKLIVSSRLSVEGPLRIKQEYIEGILETPTVLEEALPEQVKGALGQAANTMQQLPVPLRDAISSGLKVPLSGTFQRLIMISYLDEEILIIRDTVGVPEVLTSLDVPAPPLAEEVTEYES